MPLDLDTIVNSKTEKNMISKKEKANYIKKVGRPEKVGEKRNIILKCLLTESENKKLSDYCEANQITKSEVIVNFLKGL